MVILARTAALPDASTFMLSDRRNNRRNLMRNGPRNYIMLSLKCYFSCPGALKYIQTSVSFLTKRVRIPDKDDLGKLNRVLRYVRRTINLLLKMRSDSLTVIKWWFDSSYTAHPDMIVPTGATISFGRRSVTEIKNKHKINTKISR